MVAKANAAGGDGKVEDGVRQGGNGGGAQETAEEAMGSVA
jgi:hypothetical protein